MPLYEYQCQNCREVFEIRATIREKAAGLEPSCPKCGGREMRQLLSTVQMISGGKDFSPPGCGPNAGPSCCG